MNLALICPDFTGHLNPMLCLGRALGLRGHQITLVSLLSMRSRAEAAGVEFLPIGTPDEMPGIAALHARVGEQLGLAALSSSAHLFKECSTLWLRDLPGLLERGKFDAALVDQFSVGPPVCQALGLPFGMACNALAMHEEPTLPPAVTDWPLWPGWVGRLRNRVVNWLLSWGAGDVTRRINTFTRAHGLPPWSIAGSYESGLVQVAQQPAFFDFPREQLPDHFHYTGPWSEPGRDASVSFPWERLDGRPIVYASLGTVQNRLCDFYESILWATERLPVQLILSLGRQESVKLTAPIPPGALVLPYVPQLQVLQRASAVITHAGLNTALETLAAGLPMVALPLTNDQPGVARRLAWLGVAELVPYWHARPTRLHDALWRVLTRTEFRATAQACQARIKSGPTVDDAARLAEWALLHRERLTRARAVELGLVAGAS
jgi:MGT family glycosyltransferase